MTQTPTKSSAKSGGKEFALIILQEGKPQRLLLNFIRLMLNYKYGLNMEVVPDLLEAAQRFRRKGESICSVFIIQSEPVSLRSVVPVLTRRGAIPLLLLLPAAQVDELRPASAEVGNVFLCAWQEAFKTTDASLAGITTVAFEANGIGSLPEALRQKDAFTEHLKTRLKSLTTLPTLPAIVLRIMTLIRNPEATMDQLETILCRDPAVVLKVMQVVNSAAFSGDREQRWTLKDALVRLGLKQVGAIAQQIAMINSFIKPQESQFDLRRFWEHSVACAVVADRLCSGKLVTLEEEIPFDEYWLAALLHDIGKLVQGLFYWEVFEQMLTQMGKKPFREVEEQFGVVDHESIAELILTKADMNSAIVQGVALHHSIGEPPNPLARLLYLADNLSKELGLSSLPDEPVKYDKTILDSFKLGREDVQQLKESLEESVIEEVKKMVDQCLGG
jgi:HD-like signal output (HDOD) protein